MINSRKIEDLLPIVSAKVSNFMTKCREAGFEVLITSTYRDVESQNELYAQGRTKPGKIVTNARGGQSWHNHRCAIDIVPLRHGKPVWGTSGDGIDEDPSDDDRDDLELWQRIGAIGESCGLEWAGRWNGKLREMAHFQYTGGLSLAELQAGKKVQ